MIQLSMYNGSWRITVTGETWEFPNQESFKETLNKLIQYKSGFGNLKKEGKKNERNK